MPHSSKYPNYYVHWKTGHGELRAPFAYDTPIKGYDIDTSHISLGPGGFLELETGYIWDFGSGPAVDTPDMVYASLNHDAFYELMNLKLLPWKERKRVDKHFIKLLKKAKMPGWRRAYVYAGVRWGWAIVRIFKK